MVGTGEWDLELCVVFRQPARLCYIFANPVSFYVASGNNGVSPEVC